MKEHQVIMRTALYLLKEKNAKILRMSVGQHRTYIKNSLLKNGVAKDAIMKIEFKGASGNCVRGKGLIKGDIVADLTFGEKHVQKVLQIEAKGGDVYYGIYTALGQFLVCKHSRSQYYWFAFAFPYSWRKQLRKVLRCDGKVKPVVDDIIKQYTKQGQGLWFYFVRNDGYVKQETWKHALR